MSTAKQAPEHAPETSIGKVPLPPSPDETPLGAHISAAGGIASAPSRAVEIGASAMQLFTKVANQWKEREISVEDAQPFQAALAKNCVRFINAHDS